MECMSRALLKPQNFMRGFEHNPSVKKKAHTMYTVCAFLLDMDIRG